MLAMNTLKAKIMVTLNFMQECHPVRSLRLPFKTWTCEFVFFSAVSQGYQTGTIDEHVIIGNDVLMKCTVPSFVGDFVSVVGWIDNMGNTYLANARYGNKFLELASW